MLHTPTIFHAAPRAPVLITAVEGACEAIARRFRPFCSRRCVDIDSTAGSPAATRSWRRSSEPPLRTGRHASDTRKLNGPGGVEPMVGTAVARSPLPVRGHVGAAGARRDLLALLVVDDWMNAGNAGPRTTRFHRV